MMMLSATMMTRFSERDLARLSPFLARSSLTSALRVSRVVATQMKTNSVAGIAHTMCGIGSWPHRPMARLIPKKAAVETAVPQKSLLSVAHPIGVSPNSMKSKVELTKFMNTSPWSTPHHKGCPLSSAAGRNSATPATAAAIAQGWRESNIFTCCRRMAYIIVSQVDIETLPSPLGIGETLACPPGRWTPVMVSFPRSRVFSPGGACCPTVAPGTECPPSGCSLAMNLVAPRNGDVV
mmetsp:Transcript_28452/g.90637  ORF Transcript_28452/g.90637 Transcript_28452/m.90637 type:complete len:237 (+) Transcript_28452:2200-2910(+)